MCSVLEILLHGAVALLHNSTAKRTQEARQPLAALKVREGDPGREVHLHP